MDAHAKLVEDLNCSETFQNYERAYTETTGMPLTLRPAETWQLPFRGKARENGFCRLMAGQAHTCAACLQLQGKLAQNAVDRPATITCAYGLCETAVPVKLGPGTVGYLQTGQVLRRKPTEASFQRAVAQAAKRGVDIANEPIRRAYFQTPVVSQRKLDSVTDLLAIFADHLAMKSNQLMVRKANDEPPMIARAKQFIREHQGEEMSLGLVADQMNVSRFHFCKQFRRAAGLSFTEFVSRTRMERAGNLLLNPNLRISEIAYETGFQSLTSFNRVFKKLLGESPTRFRGRLAAAD